MTGDHAIVTVRRAYRGLLGALQDERCGIVSSSEESKKPKLPLVMGAIGVGGGVSLHVVTCRHSHRHSRFRGSHVPRVTSRAFPVARAQLSVSRDSAESSSSAPPIVSETTKTAAIDPEGEEEEGGCREESIGGRVLLRNNVVDFPRHRCRRRHRRRKSDLGREISSRSTRVWEDEKDSDEIDRKGSVRGIDFDLVSTTPNSTTEEEHEESASLGEFSQLDNLKERWETLPPRLRGLAMLNLLMAGFGSNIVFLKAAGQTVDPVVFSAARFALAALIFAPFLAGALDAAADKRILRGGIELGVWAGLGYLTQNIGLVHCDASRAGFVSSFTVIAVPVLASFSGRVVSGKTWAAVAAALIGLSVMEGVDFASQPAIAAVTDPTTISLNEVTGSTAQEGVALVLISALFFGMHIFRTDVIFGDQEENSSAPSSDLATPALDAGAEKDSGAALVMDPQQSLSLVAVQLAVVAVVCTALAVATNADGLLRFLFGGGVEGAHTPWGTVVYCGVVTTAACLYFEARALQLVQSQDAALVYVTEPLWGAVFAFAFLGERMEANEFVGGAIILAATALANMDISGKKTWVALAAKKVP